MDYDKYSVMQYSVGSILAFIEAGEIAIPEIQRPFVWKASQVRDLVDSLFSGYPTGYLIIWQNPDVKLKDGGSAIGKKVLIDGQQRVTALMTAIAGKAILTDDYDERVIRIAFNPLASDNDERFAVQTPAHIKSSFWIPDISVIFKSDFDNFSFITDYIEKNPGVDSRMINSKVNQLLAIKNCQMGVISLISSLDIGEVTDIFVRINSQGKRLNEADFAMSKIAADEKYGGNMLRKAIDYFCHLAVDPAFYSKLSEKDRPFMESEYAEKLKWLKDDKEAIYDPDYNDMLRVSFMHVFGRAKLGDLVSLLSGRDFEERTFKEEIARDSFNKLTTGVKNFMNEYDFKQFVIAIKSAGFKSEKLLNSQVTLDFAYTLYLLLKNNGDVSRAEVQHCIQRWFVFTTLTGRYTGSPETQMDRDLRDIGTKGFKAFLSENESARLSDSFWDIELVQRLDTSSISSPYLSVFFAAQIYNKESSLFSNSTSVEDLITIGGDVHHIFPKEYLKSNGFEDKSKYNQVGNFTYLDTGVNIAIGKKAPKEYFSIVREQCENEQFKIGDINNAEKLNDNLKCNCIPDEIFSMDVNDFPVFLQKRRALMANKIKEYYYSL